MGGEERWCVVTGGRGFAARHLVEMLIRYDMFLVRIADLGPSIKLDPTEEKGILGEAIQSGHAQYVSVDLRDKSQVLEACQGAEVVFHMAAPDSSINNYELHHSVNVKGTKNVIDACVDLKVKRLIYTSSPSVVFDGVHGIINGDESLPYPAKDGLRRTIESYSHLRAECQPKKDGPSKAFIYLGRGRGCGWGLIMLRANGIHAKTVVGESCVEEQQSRNCRLYS